ncbi:MAG: amino acid adenylation domain-containing protein, partial [Cyanobacteria bacterium REEB494]|nr:amino acid adenylation domain-containing protein [Cyanobacteria bacterium REEB494]
AYVLYTSGSTGRPKGVMVPHGALTNFLCSMQKSPGIERTDRLLAITTLAFDIAGLELYLPLIAGARLIIASRAAVVDGKQLIHLLQQHEITLLQATPAGWQMLLASGWEGKRDLKALAGGEALPGSLAEALLPRTASLWNLYGPTETTIWSTTQLIHRPDAISIGRPIANTQIYVLDCLLQPRPIGVVGDLYIGGEGVARGYLNRPELTAERFIPNPFGPGRLYKTGDLARWLPDGNIEYLGRVDHQVKIRGFRIELGEIEAVLGSHPAVQTCVVVAREDAPGDKRLVAYLVEAAPGLLPTDTRERVAALRSHLQSRLPDYMVPGAFVWLDALPLTPNGKVDRRALPAPESSVSSESHAAPRTASEQALAEIWQQVLRVDQVGVQDNFFGLGGHSLLATQVLSRIRQQLSVELPLRALFEAPTVEGLAAEVDKLRPASGADAFSAILPADRSQPLPLSHAQERLWFLDQLDSSHSAYNMPGAVRLSGELDVAALECSLQEIVRRHEALRTVFGLQEGQPVQQILPAAFHLPLIDLSMLEGQDAEVERLLAAEIHHAFDLAQGPLFRATLLCLQPQREHVLLLNLHHTVGDGWSLEVLQRELAVLYNAFRQGQRTPLPELPLQYADFALWQRCWLAEGALEEQLLWWQEYLAAAPELLPLPTDRPRPPVQSYRGAIHTVALAPDLIEALHALAGRSGATHFMVLLAAFQLLLMRWSGQSDIVVGVPVANRNRVEIEPLIGLFVNTLAVRSQLQDETEIPLSFAALLEQVRQNMLDAQRRQDVPFEKVVERLQPVRALSHSPIFQVMFNLLQTTAAPLTLSGVRVEPVEAAYSIAKFDLTLTVVENHDAVSTAAFEYNTDLFDRATVERMAGHFETLLRGIVADPACSVAALPLLTTAERHQLLVEWNETAADFGQDRCIHTLFEEQVERTPDAVAVVFEEAQLTYAELNARANQLAHTLQGLGVGPDVLVGLCVERSLEMVVGLLGILKAGGAYVPLDPTYPAERLAFMLEDAAVSVLLTQALLLGVLPMAATQVICLDRDWPAVALNPTANLHSPVQPHHLAYVIYTSGSTGRPKGAMNTHVGICNQLLWLQATYPFTCLDRMLQKTSLGFDAAVWEIFSPLLAGASLVVASPDGHRDPAYLVRVIRERAVSIVQFVPTALRALLDEPGIALCHTLRRVFCGGEALSIGLQTQVSKMLAVQLINLYGPTEAAVQSVVWPCESDDYRGIVPIGRPVANTQAYILDVHQQPTPVGVAGELHIGGVQVGAGYLNRPELTAERFIPNPFGPGRLYKTGDLARWLPDGNIEYLGRV